MATTITTSNSVVGLTVILPTACPCGSFEAVTGSSRGPHCASLICARCNHHRGWMSAAVFYFIGAIVEHHGRPTEPIVVGRSA
jgi:hypothetical protein